MKQQQISISKTESLEHALEMIVKLGLVNTDASQTKKLEQIIEFAESHLSEEISLSERSPAHQEFFSR